jgi:two-component system, NtrC family, response regulator AtoC
MGANDRRSRLEGGWVLQGGGRRRMRFVLGETELAHADIGLVVGRHPALCDRLIDDMTISRRHCRFSLREGRLLVEDLNSLNGTRVAGRDIAPFKPVVLADGDTVTLGRLALTVSRVMAEAGA